MPTIAACQGRIPLSSFIFYLLSSTNLSAQVVVNPFLNYEVNHYSIVLPDTNLSYRFNLDNQLFKYAGSDTFYAGIDGGLNYKTGAISHYDNYEDNLHYMLSPYIHYTLPANISFDVRVNVENIKDDPL